MADLKALGSEKLQGMDKIRRILEIAHYNEKPKEYTNENETLNYTITLADGYTYGIVKEKLGYIIKKGINESFLDCSPLIVAAMVAFGRNIDTSLNKVEPAKKLFCP